MNKGEFIKSIAQKGEFTNKEAEAAYNAFVGTVAEALKAGDTISLAGFGTFSVKERAARMGHNPRNGEAMEIPASKAPSFKAGKALKEAVAK